MCAVDDANFSKVNYLIKSKYYCVLQVSKEATFAILSNESILLGLQGGEKNHFE